MSFPHKQIIIGQCLVVFHNNLMLDVDAVSWLRAFTTVEIMAFLHFVMFKW